MKKVFGKNVSKALALLLSAALLLTMPCLSASAVTIILDDGTEKELPLEGTVYDTDWKYNESTKTLHLSLSDSPNFSTSGGQVFIPEQLIAETEHLVVDSNCSNDSDTGLLDQWLLGYDFTETAVSLKDVTVKMVGRKDEGRGLAVENFSSHDGVLFVRHDDLIESGDEAVPARSATLFVYPQQKTDKEFTLKADENLVYDGFRNLYYEVLPEYPMCRSLNYNKYLEKMNVEDDNIFGYTSENGVICSLSGSGKAIVFCPKTVEGAAPVPEGTSFIGHYAFCDCTKLTSVSVPPSVDHIGVRAFMNCTSLASAELSDFGDEDLMGYNSRLIEDQAFCGCSALKTVKIGFGQEVNGFTGCKALETVTLAKGITGILQEAFLGCTSLKQIEFPDTLEYIGRSAFENCTSLENVVIGEAVETIGSRAFMGCLSLKTAEIKSGSVGCPKSFGENNEYKPDYSQAIQAAVPGLFSDCPSLTKITVTESNPAFFVRDGVLFQRMIVENKEELKEVLGTPELLHIVGYEAGSEREELDLSGEHELYYLTAYAFNGAKNLKKLTLPDEMTDIRSDSLCRCGLTSMTFPKNVESIADGVLSDCPELTEITFPEHVSFPHDARCGINVPKLRTVTFLADNSTSDYYSPFEGSPSGVGMTWSVEENGDTHSDVMEGITVRANRFFSGVNGYTDDFADMAMFCRWKFEDLATGKTIDFSDKANEKTTRWNVDEATGIIMSFAADKKDGRGYEFDVKASSSDSSSSLSGDNIYLVNDGGKQMYYSIEADTSGYVEGSRYDLADDMEVRIPVASADSSVKRIVNGSAEDMEYKTANGCVIFTQKGSGETSPDSDSKDTDTEEKLSDTDVKDTDTSADDTDTEEKLSDTDVKDTDTSADGTDTEEKLSDTDVKDTDSSADDTDTNDGSVLGDVDGDGQVTSSDALLVLRVSVLMENSTEELVKLADVDGDGSLTSADALELLRYSVGLIEATPIGKPL